MSNPVFQENVSNISQAQQHGAKVLETAGLDLPRLDASLLLAHVLGVSREQLLLNQDNILNRNELKEFYSLLQRRLHHEPIAYILGQKEFWGLDFSVTPDTLIPRPDSETVIEAALRWVPNRAEPVALLDIGTGSGCLLIALLKELPQAQGVGVDNSERALQVAETNARRHGVFDRTRFLTSHWCDALNGTFDLIISNPPYIASGVEATLMTDVVQYEPHAALFAGVDGLDAYRALAPRLAGRLRAGGHVVLEVGEGQAKAVTMLLSAEGLKPEGIMTDLAGIDRCVIATTH